MILGAEIADELDADGQGAVLQLRPRSGVGARGGFKPEADRPGGQAP